MPVVKNINSLTSEQLVKELRSRDVVIPSASTAKKDVLINLYRAHVLLDGGRPNDASYYSSDDDNADGEQFNSRNKPQSKSLQVTLNSNNGDDGENDDDDDDVVNLSDSELHAKLKQYDNNIGPVTNTTRSIYRKKLVKYITGKLSSPKKQPQPEIAYSDDDDDDDEDVEMVVEGSGLDNDNDDEGVDDDDDDGGAVEGDDDDNRGENPIHEPIITQRRVFTNFERDQFPAKSQLHHPPNIFQHHHHQQKHRHNNDFNAASSDDDDDGGNDFNPNNNLSTITGRPPLSTSYPTSFSHHYIYKSPYYDPPKNVDSNDRYSYNGSGDSKFKRVPKNKTDYDWSRRNQSEESRSYCKISLVVLFAVAILVALAYLVYVNIEPDYIPKLNW